MNRARRALLLSFANRYSALSLRFIMMVALARLLSPEQYGVFAAAAAAIGVATVLADMGVKQYLVQSAELTDAARRAALGVSLTVAAVLAATIDSAVVLAPTALLDRQLRAVVAILNVTLLMQPLNSLATAVLTRELRFGMLCCAALIETVVQAAVAIGLAAAGFGAFSLAWGTVAQTGVGTAVLCVVAPPVRPSLAGCRAAFGFGGRWALIQATWRTGDALARLVVGSLLGLGAVGLLSRAQSIVQLFDRSLTDAVNPVVLPAISERQRAGHELASIYLRQVACIAGFAWPFFGAVAWLLAGPLVRLLLGPAWLGAVPAVRMLALGGLFLPIAGTALPYIVASDAIGQWVPIEISIQAIRVALVAVGSLISLPAACGGLAFAVALEALLAERLLRQRLDYRGRDMLRALASNVAPTTACLTAAAMASLALASRTSMPEVVIAGAASAGGSAWLLSLPAVDHPLWTEARLVYKRLVTVRATVKRLAAQLLYPLRYLPGQLGDRIAVTCFNRWRKWYIVPGLTPEAFFQRLHHRRIAYVVLRWFDDLPHLASGHDIDILVADEQLPLLRDLLSRWPLGQACDIYSTTGLPGFAYCPWFMPRLPANEIAALPPHHAKAVLTRTVANRNGISVPEPRDHFNMLAWHAIYLKGAWSGLPAETDAETSASDPSHDYAATLAALAGELGIALPEPLTMEALDELLAKEDWRPAYDTLEKLARWHPWIARKFFPAASVPEPGLTAFFIRERAVANGLAPRISELIGSRGFEILHTVDLTLERSAVLARAVRGGNWGRGPWPVSGGGPRQVLIAFDIIPHAPSAAERRQYPNLDNARSLAAKDCIRAFINDRLPCAHRYNAIHATDNSREAWQIVRQLLSKEEAALHETIRQRKLVFTTPQPVVHDLTRHGNRAKLELIRYRGKLAIRKTFRAGALRFLQREISFYTRFSQERNELLPLLESGFNYFIVPFYENLSMRRRLFGIHPPRLMPLAQVRQLASFLGYVMEAGYDPIDITPANNVLLGSAGMKVIDFEFVHCPGSAVQPEHSLCLTGIDQTFSGDAPPYVAYLRAPYQMQWYPYTGLGLRSFLHDPHWVQTVKRVGHYPLLLSTWAFHGSWRRIVPLARRAKSALAECRREIPCAGADAADRRFDGLFGG